MTYSGSPNPDPGDIKANEEMLNRQREEKAEQDRIEEERRILEEEVPFWRRQKQLEGGDFMEDPEGPHYQSIAAETGIGIAADLTTVGLLGIPVVGQGLYYGINFGVGYGANALAQWMRGDWDEFSHGEALAAGGFQTIPMGTTLKGLKGLRRAAVKGAVGGAGMAQLEVGIDERRRLTAQELMLSSILGGTVAGGFKSAELAGDVIDNTRRQFTGLTEGLGGTGGAPAMSGGSVGPFRASYVEPEFEHTAKVLQRLFNNNLTIDGRERRFNFIKLQNDRTNTKVANDTFRRSLGVDMSTTKFYKIGQSFQDQRRAELGGFMALYGDAMRNNKVRHYRKVPGKKNPQLVLDADGKPELVSSPIDPSKIELDHRVTLMQSLGMYHNTAYGSDLWNDIQRTALRRMDPGTGKGYKPGDTVDNLGLVDPESHRVKTRFFNDLHGKDSGGMKYWRGKHRDTGMSRLDIMSNSHTDKTLKNGKSYRDMHLEIVEDYFDHIDKGSKILDDALAMWDAEYRDDLVPDHIAETLGKVTLDAETYDYTPKKLKEIVTDIILDAGPRRSKENWAMAFQEYPDPDAIDKIIWMNERSEAGMEAILDVLFKGSTPKQALKKWKSLDQQIELPILKEAVKQAKANPDILELMKAKRGNTPGNTGKPTYDDPSDKGLE